ncbi:MAG TPA: DinB family protein [Vicinamibacterales bacterium]|jgi:uncharacterized damage-inducible protein DinB|nr:DinB family protein [Vicinamibacterales bacterium]
MHPRIHELLTYLDQQRALLRSVVDAVPAESRERQPAAGEWSVANVLEHLAIVEQRVGAFLSSMIAAAKADRLGAETSSEPLLPSLGVERVLNWTEKVTAPDLLHPTGLDAAAAWAALEQAGATLRDAVRSGDGFALGTLVRPHPLFGPISLYHWIAFAGAHEARHAAQIKAIAASLSHT